MPPKRPAGGEAAKLIVTFLGVSVLAGVLTAGLLLPATGAIGLTAQSTAETFEEIPSELRTPPLSQATRIYDASGGEIATVYYRDRTVVEWDDIAPTMRDAIVAIEDSRFYEHNGFDLRATLRALTRNAQAGGVAEGGSTLTQQYVKNVFVEQAGDDAEAVAEAQRQTVGRKIEEVKYAIQLEEELTKEEILTNYLNITFFGQQAYGVEAAAQRYFSKSAKDLNLQESATLAGLVQSPTRFDPTSNPEEARERRNLVLQRMADTGFIAQEEADAAKATEIELNVTEPRSGCITAVNGAGFFCDYVRNVILNDPAFGETEEERQELWKTGGLEIHTTLNPQAQTSVVDSVTSHVYETDPVVSAMTIVEPGTGKILAMGQSLPYGVDANQNQTQINFNVPANMGGGNGFQPGSTFKAITMAAALEDGKTPTTEYSSPYRMDYPDMRDCAGGGVPGGGATVENENESEVGPYTMTDAAKLSVNTYFVQMTEDIGLCKLVRMTEALGMEEQASGDPLAVVGSYTLGVNLVTPLQMAAAYAAFANDGTYCTPVALTKVVGLDGQEIPVPQTQCNQAMSERTADTVSAILEEVNRDGTGREASLDGVENAGKTGTTDGRMAAWFAGFTKDLAGAVWVGDPENQEEMIDITIGGVYKEFAYGSDTPGPIWHDGMQGALDGSTPPLDQSPMPLEKPRDDNRDNNNDRNDNDRGNDNNDRNNNGGDNNRGNNRRDD
ncbi:transglycosylase domain-containing protein [Allostreptomyces psammosilenae]|uniref:Membrane peptidoglycan carboxypeptidase n=1 Tax=Allostreptomyces psammosilenae TaxID=1892865 RepID=A0A852ZVD6_9ACTN|nr:transglycosylase domain-containing protein [Allostreptomyces psammosilenae]NYI05597.1 membrane peptidoglycan carboxypeptidase [Allostreptomyces psammosilenae]